MIRTGLLTLHLAPCLLLVGCSTVTIRTPECEMNYTRFMGGDMEGITLKVCNSTAKIAKTDGSADALSSLLPLLIKGASVP